MDFVSSAQNYMLLFKDFRHWETVLKVIMVTFYLFVSFWEAQHPLLTSAVYRLEQGSETAGRLYGLPTMPSS